MSSPGPWQWPGLLVYKDRPTAGSRVGGAMSVLLRSQTLFTVVPSLHVRPILVCSRLSERQQSHGWSDPAGRDSAGCNSFR